MRQKGDILVGQESHACSKSAGRGAESCQCGEEWACAIRRRVSLTGCSGLGKQNESVVEGLTCVDSAMAQIPPIGEVL
jgi:hypothetical protein